MQKALAHRSPGEDRRSLWVLGELLTQIVPSWRTGGAYSLFEIATPPGGGPPPHVQHREDEAFYVLAGEYEFLSGEEKTRMGAGTLIYVPKGTLHTHENAGKVVGRMLMSQTPGGIYELFFEKAGVPADDRADQPAFRNRQDAADIRNIAAEYGIEIPPPVAKEPQSETDSRGSR